MYIGPEIFSVSKNTGKLRLLSGFDHETAQTYTITLHATSGTMTVDQVITYHALILLWQFHASLYSINSKQVCCSQ